MRVLAYLHMAPPHHNAGAELMAHTLLRDLYRRGHEIRVLVARMPGDTYVHEGVTYSRGSSIPEVGRWFRWCDVAVTHLDLTRVAVQHANRYRKPLAHLVHNDRQLEFHGVEPGRGTLAVFNSRWIADTVDWPGESLVIRPPVVAADYRTVPGGCLTLINLSLSKGAEVFYELAERMPEHRFLGVRGSYGRQVVPRRLPANVTIVGNTPGIKAVYARTRVLLMPSDYESWGRVAVEAAVSGIPTVAHPTPGLRESLGSGGIFADRDDVSAWESVLRRLDQPAAYKRASSRALARSAELDPTPDFDAFESALRGLV